MHEKHIYKIKVLFTVITVIFVSIITVATKMDVFNSLHVFLNQEYKYLSYKNEFEKYSGAANTISSLSNETVKDERADAKGIPVLLYHRLDDSIEGQNVQIEKFKDQMFSLKKNGWQTITLSEFNNYMHNKIHVPEKSFLLTFDDGAKDSYYPVDPLLRVLNYSAVNFIIPKYSINSKSSYYLSKSEIQRMIDSSRWEIGAHGYDSHINVLIDAKGELAPYLGNKMWIENQNRLETDDEYIKRISVDLLESKRTLQETFGLAEVDFAFPFGDYGQRSKNFTDARSIVIRETSNLYGLAFYQKDSNEEDPFNHSTTSPFMIKRIEVLPTWSGEDLISYLDIFINI